jgi:uncharacterized membrane protein
MKKLFIIQFLFVLFPIAAMSQETKIQLTEKVSISFPEKPDVRNMQEVATVYTLKLADSTASFNVSIQNLEKSNSLTAEMLETAQLDPSFWEQLESSFIAQLGSETKALSREIKKIGTKDVLNLVLNTVRNGKKLEISAYVFIEGVHSINVGHNKRADTASLDLKNKFFNSLKILD